MLVWCRAQLSFWKIRGTYNDPYQGLVRWLCFSMKLKFQANRRVNERLQWECLIIGIVRWEFVVQKLWMVSAIKLQSCWSKNKGHDELQNCQKNWKSDSCCNVGPTWAALPGARILTDAHPTNVYKQYPGLVETVKAKPCLVEQYFTSAGAKREISR